MGKIIILFTAVILLLGINSPRKFSIPKQVDQDELRKNVISDPKLFADPLSSNYFWVNDVSGDRPRKVHISFIHSIAVGGFSIFFPGNMETNSSYVPDDFDVYTKPVGAGWELADQERHFGRSSYVLKLKENIDLEGINLVLLGSKHENSEVRISDLKIYTKTNVNLREYLLWLVSSNSKSVWSYLGLSILFYIVIMAPGIGLLTFFFSNKKKSVDLGTTFVFGPLLSMLVLAGSTLGYIISKNQTFLSIYLPYFVIGSIIFFRKKVYRKLGDIKFLLLLSIAFLLATTLLQITRDTLLNLNYIETFLDNLNPLSLSSYFGYHADNTMPWGIARSFLHQASPFSQEALHYRLGQPASSVTNRIPTLSLIVAPILAFFGESHFVFQRFLNVLVSFYYLAVFWTIKQFFSEKVSRLTILLLLLSVPISLTTWNAELNIKYVSMYPLILAAGFLVKGGTGSLLSISGLFVFSVLIHPMAILFAPAFTIVFLLKRKTFGGMLFESVVSCLPAVGVLAVWFVLTALVKDNPDPSTGSIPSSNIYTFFNADSLTWTNKAANIINIFIPDYLNRFYPNFLSGEYARLFFRTSIIGSLSPFFTYYLFFRTKIITIANHLLVIALSVIPQIIFWLHPHYYDFSSFALFFPFAVPFLFALVVQELIKDTPGKRFLYIFSYVVFMGISFFVTSNAFPDLKYWDNVISTYTIALWSIFILVSIYTLKSQAKT